MIKPTISIKGKITTPQKIEGKTNASIIKVYPELENMTIAPTIEEQKFKSSKYGFDEVTVEPVTANIDDGIKPENIKEGINILGVEGEFKSLDTSDATATPSDVLDGKIAYSANNTRIEGTYIPLDTSDATATETDILLGKTAYVNGEKINGTYEVKGEEIIITPSKEEQVKEGIFKKITIAGDSDLIPENIKKDVEIFGVKGIGNIVEAKITNASYLFYKNARMDYLYEILSLCENVSDTSNMFYQSTSLTDLDLSSFNTSNVTDMSNMFDGCLKLTDLDLSSFNTSNVTDMSYMFFGCSKLTNLDLNNFNTSNVTDMSYMFFGCSKLTNLDLSSFNANNVTSMSNMFYGCASLTDLDLSSFNTSNVANMSYMFYNCGLLKNLDLSNFDMGKIINSSYVLRNCRNLTNLKFGTNLGKGYTYKSNNYGNYQLSLSSNNLLTHDSLMNVINNLYDLNLTYDVANGGKLYTQSLLLGTTNIAKLTSEEIAIATNKGWTVS